MTDRARSVLMDVQQAQGAGFVDYDGWLWATNFGDVGREYAAIREGACLWDVYGLQKWDVRGTDAIPAIQRVFANNLQTLDDAQVRYGAFVNSHGAMIDDGTVYRHGHDHLWVMTNAEDFDRQIAEAMDGLAVTFESMTQHMPLISVQGPQSRDLLQGLTDVDLASLRYFRFLPEQVLVAGISTWVMRTGFSGELGFELIPARDDAVPLWTALSAAGGVPVGLDAIEIARVEAGLVMIDSDYFPGETSPFDLSLDKTVVLDPPLGVVASEILAKTAAAPPLRFKTLRIEGHEVPTAGATVLRSGTAVGQVTSPVASPTFGVIGLATIATEHSADGTSVEVALDEEAKRTARAFVSPLSIHDPAKRKPRS